MKLTYRGTSYESDIPTVDVTEGEVGGKYRGQNWSYRHPRHIPVPWPPRNLKYRGLSLVKGQTATAEAVAIAKMTEKLAPIQPQSVALLTGKVSDSVARPGKFSDSDVADAERQRVVAHTERQKVERPIAKNNIGPIHQANLCKILDRRKQAAREQGNEELLKQLEDESQYLVCC